MPGIVREKISICTLVHGQTFASLNSGERFYFLLFRVTNLEIFPRVRDNEEAATSHITLKEKEEEREREI